MEHLRDAFIAYLRAERGLSGKTVDAYGADLARYGGYLTKARVSDADDVRQSHVEGHLDALAEQGLSPRSRARHLAAIRMFHRFLVDEQHAKADPTENIETPSFAAK